MIDSRGALRMLAITDTIAAVASAPGAAGRAVVRLSGDAAHEVVGRVFVPEDAQAWVQASGPRRHRGHVALPGAPVPLPVEAWSWRGTRSYTGQPSVELHCVGSPPLVDALLTQLLAHGARPAQAGEFTLRAFLAGRIDLLQAEAVLGVIEATDDQQLSAALTQLAGGMSARFRELHETLLIDLADLEAGLDFVDEDIEFIERDQLRERLDSAAATIAALQEQADRRLQTRPQAVVVLAGLPNAGKSTLFNALVGRESAIVSPQPGTTRDWLVAEVTWDGCAIELLDTAGRDAAADEISSAAREAADERLAAADLVVWCTAADLSPANAQEDAQWRLACERVARSVLPVTTKSDAAANCSTNGRVSLSAKTGAGLPDLRREIVRRVDLRGQHVGELLASTAARCRDSLRSALDAIRHARALLDADAGDELIAVELRGALEQTGHVAGQVSTDDLLDRIFSRFCIGK
ncbi:MAG: tRNA modification GTPase [Planctomycetaceae bacterium]|nr:tRNA modification GTPase [Planctomycetaceae bacterium]